MKQTAFRFLLVMIFSLLLVGCAAPGSAQVINLDKLSPLPTPATGGVIPLRVAVAAVISPQGTVESYSALLDYLRDRLDRPVELVQRPFFLPYPYVAFRDFGDYCDVFGNLLAILFGVANPAQEKRILDYLHQVGIADPYPVGVLHPVIHPGNKDWREYYRNNNLNLPEQYHNGGIWPFVGGFYIAGLIKAGRMVEERLQLEKLAKVNKLGVDGEWEFNEWCHGRSGQPMGYPHQAWSAGMYVFAYHCVKNGRLPFWGKESV